MNKIIISILSILLIASNGFCAPINTPNCTINAAAKSNPLKQPTIKEIKAAPKHLNTVIKITGKYKGNNSKIGPPPITRSDYILEDQTGQIFVTGPLPKKVTRKNIGKTITIQAKVKSTVVTLLGKKNKIIYLQIQ